MWIQEEDWTPMFRQNIGNKYRLFFAIKFVNNMVTNLLGSNILPIFALVFEKLLLIHIGQYWYPDCHNPGSTYVHELAIFWCTQICRGSCVHA